MKELLDSEKIKVSNKEEFENFIKQEGTCYYNELKKCSNIGYITGSIQYCVPPCYTCENYLNIK